jgi:hypothetical protein
VATVADAEALGFRRAWLWKGAATVARRNSVTVEQD